MALEMPLCGVVFLEQLSKLGKHFMFDLLFVCNNYHHMCNTISPNIYIWPFSLRYSFVRDDIFFFAETTCNLQRFQYHKKAHILFFSHKP